MARLRFWAFNGNITFSGPLSAYSPYGLAGSNQSIIAPFFADVDTRGAGSALTSYGTGTYAGHTAFGITWPGVGYFSESTDKLDDFQVILVDRSDIDAGDFDIYFNYAPCSGRRVAPAEAMMVSAAIVPLPDTAMEPSQAPVKSPTSCPVPRSVAH